MPKKLKLHNQRILELMDDLIRNKKCADESEFLKRIKYKNKTNISQVKAGVRGFTEVHINALAVYYQVDLNHLFIKNYSNRFRKEAIENDGIAMIREGLALLEKQNKK